MDWSSDRIDRLTRLWADGLSAAQIAAELGVTRNAVLGKVHRLGLQTRYRGSSRKWRKPLVIADGVTIPAKQRRTLLGLKANTCRWPVGHPGTADFFFCGAPCDPKQPYCEGHAEVAFRRLEPRPIRSYLPRALLASVGAE